MPYKILGATLLLGALALFVGKPVFAQEPDIARKPQSCGQSTVDLVLQRLQETLTNQRDHKDVLVAPDDVVKSICKVDPTTPGQSIVALDYLDPLDADGKVALAIVDTASRHVVAFLGDAHIYSGTPNPQIDSDSLWIDTTRYDLAKGVLAFGVEWSDGYSPSCGDGEPGPTLDLFVRDGHRIRQILQGFSTSQTWILQGGAGRCGPLAKPGAVEISQSTRAAISVAGTSSHGYRDLEIHKVFSVSGLPGASCRYKLQYDGKRYADFGSSGNCNAMSMAYQKAAEAKLRMKVVSF